MSRAWDQSFPKLLIYTSFFRMHLVLPSLYRTPQGERVDTKGPGRREQVKRGIHCFNRRGERARNKSTIHPGLIPKIIACKMEKACGVSLDTIKISGSEEGQKAKK